MFRAKTQRHSELDVLERFDGVYLSIAERAQDLLGAKIVLFVLVFVSFVTFVVKCPFRIPCGSAALG
jgi:hypothetical protein